MAKLRQQLDQLDSAFIFERRIEKATYDRQAARLREEMLLVDLERHELTLEELDLEGTLAFAENLACNAARLWVEASPEQKVRLQAVYFPDGLIFDGQEFGTAPTCLAFSTLVRNSGTEYGVASPAGFAPAALVLGGL